MSCPKPCRATARTVSVQELNTLREAPTYVSNDTLRNNDGLTGLSNRPALWRSNKSLYHADQDHYVVRPDFARTEHKT